MKQKKMTDLFQKAPLEDITNKLIDLEDVGTQMGTQLLKPRTVASATIASHPKPSGKRKEPEPAVPVSVDPYAALPKIMSDPTKDYKGFLQYQKQKWKIQKSARTRRKHLFGEEEGGIARVIESKRRHAQLLTPIAFCPFNLEVRGRRNRKSSQMILMKTSHCQLLSAREIGRA